MRADVWPIVQDLVPQAKSEARRASQGAPGSLDRSVLESAAYLGLLQAAERWELYCSENDFDPSHVHYFAAYALRRMRGSILDELRKLDWVPRAVRQTYKQLAEHGAGLGATEAELAERTGIGKADIRRVTAAVASRPVSVDEGTFDPAVRVTTESEAAADAIMRSVVVASRALSLKGQVILAMRYYEGRELKDCAAVLGISEAEASRLHTEGVVAVREAMLAAARG